ncbi:hypothetical protein K3495_g5315 [Podosphaera aphanis]|nr:hypothetical protein K3495_g5315 [Podosphaera aphanis]
MSDLPISVRVAQAIGIIGTFYSAGACAGITGYLVPAIRQSPTPLLLAQWRQMYRSGSYTAPPTAAVTCGALSYVSYYFRFSPEWRLWALSSVLSISIVPFTFLVVFPTNKVLETWQDRNGEGVDRREVDKQITRWTYKHTARSCLSVFGGLIALFGVIR